MTTLHNTDADNRTSFVETFAYGDKSEAIRSLIEAAHSSHRFDGVTSDEHIYEALALAAKLQIGTDSHDNVA